MFRVRSSHARKGGVASTRISEMESPRKFAVYTRFPNTRTETGSRPTGMRSISEGPPFDSSVSQISSAFAGVLQTKM